MAALAGAGAARAAAAGAGAPRAGAARTGATRTGATRTGATRARAAGRRLGGRRRGPAHGPRVTASARALGGIVEPERAGRRLGSVERPLEHDRRADGVGEGAGRDRRPRPDAGVTRGVEHTAASARRRPLYRVDLVGLDERAVARHGEGEVAAVGRAGVRRAGNRI